MISLICIISLDYLEFWLTRTRPHPPFFSWRDWLFEPLGSPGDICRILLFQPIWLVWSGSNSRFPCIAASLRSCDRRFALLSAEMARGDGCDSCGAAFPRSRLRRLCRVRACAILCVSSLFFCGRFWPRCWLSAMRCSVSTFSPSVTLACSLPFPAEWGFDVLNRACATGAGGVAPAPCAYVSSSSRSRAAFSHIGWFLLGVLRHLCGVVLGAGAR